MDKHVNDFFCDYATDPEKGKFHKVIALHDAADVDWKTVSRIAPSLPKGWYELCELPITDRIQFVLDYWLATFPYHPNIDKAFTTFFSELDDIGVFIHQKTFDDPFQVQMVYSLSNDRGFYRGDVGATEDEITSLQKLFLDYILPVDYLAFLRIHKGFCKTTDCTGIISTDKMKESYEEFQALIAEQGQVKTKEGQNVDPKTLIPFYESFGMPYYQCFWGDWYPEQEMGNVYYSGGDNTISSPTKQSSEAENLAFTTFTDWLIFYLEQIEP